MSKSKDKAKRMVSWLNVHLTPFSSFQVQDILKEKLYKVNFPDYFQDVDSVLAIAFQIAIHNWRKQSKLAERGHLSSSQVVALATVPAFGS